MQAPEPAAGFRVVIVDDDAGARRAMRGALATLPGAEIVAELDGGDAAVAAIPASAADVVLLDVQMPGRDGFGVVSAIGAARMPPVVFVTAHERHAVRAFEVYAVDYVLKPFVDERLREAVGRALRRGALDRAAAAAGRLGSLMRALEDPLAAPAGAPLRRFLVHDGERIRFVAVDEVDWMEADGNYLRLHAGAECHLIRATLSSTLERLDPARFVRIHRKAAVNIDRVAEVQPWFSGDCVAILRDGAQLSVSRTYKGRLLRSF
jgi:two-component system LytT family response regulator